MKRLILCLSALLLSFSLGAQNYASLISRAGTQKEMAKYPAVTIFDSTSVFMEENGLSYVNTHTLTKILSHKGAAENSTVKVDYDPLSAYVEIREVRVHRHDGTIETITNPVLDYVAPARMIYWGASQKMVEVGHLDIGDAVEVIAFRKGFTYALLQGEDPDARYIPPMRGHFYDIVPFWSTQPVMEKVYRVNVLKEKNLQFSVYHGELQTSVQNDTTPDRQWFTFSKKNILPLKKEPYILASNDIETKLLLSTSPDWQAKSTWFYGVNEDFGSFKATPELQSKVNALLKPAKTELDSISILTHWVADNMRYSGISMGKGEGYTLHNAEMNFTDRCGVCKDKASLLIAMLRAAGFNAYAAMTMAGERIDRIPADQFNHCVCVVQRHSGEYQLLDPTWVPLVRELWSSAEQQQNYLIGLPEGADLMETPVSAPENHYVRIKGSSSLADDGTLKGEFTITAEGQSDKAVRGVFSARYSEWQNNVEAELLRLYPQAIIHSVTFTDEEKYLEQPVKITYKYTIPNYAIAGDKELIFTPLLAKGVFRRAMPHLSYNPSLETRNHPFKDRCSRLVEVEEKVMLPKNAKVASMPETQKVDGTAASYSGGYTADKRSLTFQQTATFNKRVYEADDWQDFRNCVSAQQSFAQQAVVLTK